VALSIACTNTKGGKKWDAATGRELMQLRGKPGAACLVFSPNGRRLVTADNTTVRVWDAMTGTEVYALGGQKRLMPGAVAFSLDGKRMASANGLQVKIWDAASGQELLSLTAPAKKPYSAVFGLAFTPDGNHLLAALNDGTVQYWDATPLSADVK
jgi:WD40 repeat protein